MVSGKLDANIGISLNKYKGDNMKYYSGVYLDDKNRVLQVSDDVDGLSCEILADPGVCVSNDFADTDRMIESAKTTAHFLMCDYLEINLNEFYQLYKVNKQGGLVAA